MFEEDWSYKVDFVVMIEDKFWWRFLGIWDWGDGGLEMWMFWVSIFAKYILSLKCLFKFLFQLVESFSDSSLR